MAVVVLSNIWMVCLKPQDFGFGKKLSSVFPKICSLLTVFCHQIHWRHCWNTGWNAVENTSLLQNVSQPRICSPTLGISKGGCGISHMYLISATLYLWVPLKFSETTELLRTMCRQCWPTPAPPSTLTQMGSSSVRSLPWFPRLPKSLSSPLQVCLWNWGLQSRGDLRKVHHRTLSFVPLLWHSNPIVPVN